MQISFNQIGKYLNHNLTAAELAEKITNVGLEVEEITKFSTAPSAMEGLVIGEVMTVAKHPNADKLHCTEVNIGGAELLKIVCGAPNVAVGQKVVVAVVGAVLQPTSGDAFTIKKSKIRGEDSEGMICAEDEIGLGASHEGIMVLPSETEVGIPFIDYLKPYTDYTIEVAITPNRSDAASHIGVARDVAALIGGKVKYPTVKEIKNTASPEVEIIIEDVEACPRYSGLVVKNITVKESPEWLQNALRVIGLSPINNVVDVSNFVLHELGHPLHAFDLAAIAGKKIVIKKSRLGEKFITLDKVERTLSGSELMICNAEKPMALAGVFGGMESGINPTTKDIFIESAYFAPTGIRNTSRKHQLFTDASFRFERGADPNITYTAAMRCAELILEVAGGEIIPYFYDEYPTPIKAIEVRLDFDFVNKIAGNPIPQTDIISILKGLEMELLVEDANGVNVRIPTFKTDVTRPIDLVEEIMRIYSYDKISFSKQAKTILQVDKNYRKEKLKKKLNGFLTGNGFSEAYVLSFAGEEENLKAHGAINVLNPINAEIGQMRNNIILPALKSIAHNINRQQTDVKLFEMGSYYLPDDPGYKQKDVLSLLATGNISRESWNTPSHKADFYFMKGLAEQILKLCGKEIKTSESFENEFTSYGICYNGFAYAAKIDDLLLKKMGIDKEVFYVEVDLKPLFKEGKNQLTYQPLNRFPKVERDLSLVVPSTIKYKEIKKCIASNGSSLLKNIFVFDVYQGKQVKEGFKSYAIRMELEDHSQTLEDKKVDKLMQKVMEALKADLGVEVRN